MAAFTLIATGNWSDGPTTWGTGAGVYPGASSTGDTVTIAGYTVTLDVSPANSIATITNSDNTGNIAVSTNRTLTLTGNPAITYSGTNTSGFFRVSANKLTITHDQGAGTVAVSATAAGHAIVLSGSGSCDVSNSGGVALKNSAGGRAFSGATGTSTITGEVTMTAAATGPALRVLGGTVNLTGAPTFAAGVVVGGNVAPVWVSSGTLNWTGAVTIGSGVYAAVAISNTGVLVLTGLSCALTGQLAIIYVAGTLTIDTGRVNLQTATAQCAVLGAANTNLIVGASVPSAADTRYGVTRGWPSGSTDATTGGGVVGGNGLLEIPNSSSPTGTQDATSDACVVSGKIYGSPQRTGSAAGGGGIWLPQVEQVGL